MTNKTEEKKKRLFYLNEGVDAYLPIDNLEDLYNNFEGYDGDKFEVDFMIKYLTDEEMENLPEAE